jgi:hypothetical protein
MAFMEKPGSESFPAFSFEPVRLMKQQGLRFSVGS